MNSLSAVLNVHREGRLLMPTLRSLGLAKERAEQAGGQVEIIVVADNPDDVTLSMCEAWEAADALYVINERDVGRARSFGIARSRHRWIFFHDGDDLFSSNVYAAIFDMHRSGELRDHSVYHTEFFVKFDAENEIRRMIASDDPMFDPMYLVYDWFFSNKCVIDRELLRRFPIPHNDKRTGLGNEDWSWASDTIAGGVKHGIIPMTACFYRVKDASLSLGQVPSMAHRRSRLYSRAYLRGGARIMNAANAMADIPEPSTHLQLPGPVYDAMVEQIEFEPLISNNMRRTKSAIFSKSRSLLRRAADGAASVLAGLDDRQKLFVFASDADRHLLPKLLQNLDAYQTLWSPKTHQLVIFHDTDDALYADMELHDAWGTLYITTRRMRNDFAIPHWFFYALPIRTMVQHPGGTVIDTGSEFFAKLCQRFYKLVVSQSKRIFFLQTDLVTDPAFGLAQRRARIRRILSQSDLYRASKIHLIDLFGLGSPSETGLSVTPTRSFAHKLFLDLNVTRSIVPQMQAKWMATRNAPQFIDAAENDPATPPSIFVEAGGMAAPRFAKAAKAQMAEHGASRVILPETMQHFDPVSDEFYMAWYDMANAPAMIEEMKDRLALGHAVGLAAVICGADLVQRYTEQASLFDFLEDLIARGGADKIVPADPERPSLTLVDTEYEGDTYLPLDAALANWPKADAGRRSVAAELIETFGVAFSGPEHLSSFRDAKSLDQINDFLTAWAHRKKTRCDPIAAPPSEKLLLPYLDDASYGWASSVWVPVLRYFMPPETHDARMAASVLSAAKTASIMPFAMMDMLSILATRPTAFVPPDDIANVTWRGQDGQGRHRLLSRLTQLGAEASGGDFVLLPHLEPAGAELVGATHLHAWKADDISPVRVILTEGNTVAPSFHDIEDLTIRLPQIVTQETGQDYPGGFSLNDRKLFLKTLLDAAKPRRIFCVQSYTGSLLLSEVKPAETVEYAMFCPHVDADFRITGFQNMLPGLDHNVDLYISDNTVFAKTIQEMFGLEDHRVASLFYPPNPARLEGLDRTNYSHPGSKNVLWASRLDFQKNPGIVPEIARALPDLTFHMFGRRVMNDTEFNVEALPANVVFHGEFSAVRELMSREYLCFLYTSRFDGMPNMLMEMAATGLPVVTPDLGGISDFFGKDWPCFVDHPEQPGDYVRAIRSTQDAAQHAALCARQRRALEHRSQDRLFSAIRDLSPQTNTQTDPGTSPRTSGVFIRARRD